jgi:hypothetical protein
MRASTDRVVRLRFLGWVLEQRERWVCGVFVGGPENPGCAAVWHRGFTGRRGVGGASGRVNASPKEGESHFDSQVLLKFLESSFTPSRCESLSTERTVLDGEPPTFHSIVRMIHAQ